ncbi:MAG: hypothetical protein JSV25_09590 [Spirochaetota bacterium]|nr:MAG: hypothetical protein JSV25_09590 [Spirochaetota bacterium]
MYKRIKRWVLCTISISLVVLFFYFPSFAQEEQEIEVEVSTVRARLSPNFEFTLPSGNVYLHLLENFNNLNMAFNLNYNILDNNINGNITFAYPINRVTPSIMFSEDLDFENYIVPSVEGGTVTLVPTDKYISRTRNIELSLGYKVTDHFSIIPSFLISDIFKGSLTTSRIVDDGTDLIPRLSFVYNTVRAQDPTKGLYFNGLYFRSAFGMRVRHSFDNPITLDHVNNLLFYFNFGDLWMLQQKVNFSYPLYVWNNEKAGFYSLGGFDTIRGVVYGSIQVYRFLLLSTNLEHEIFKGAEVPFTPFNLEAKIHQFRLFMIFDELLGQKSLDAASPVQSYTSIGGGFAFVISGEEKGHFEIKIYAAQQLGVDFAPIIYLKTSLFDLEQQL